MMHFHEKSHRAHAEKGLNKEKYETWKEEDTVDFWRHQRMYNLILPWLEAFENASWLTIGDGRYGSDAHYISRYSKNVLATDINDVHLKIAKENGFIDEYQIENAEELSFPDNTFDFVFCKESYHHFPRPAIALYEMLRVAKKAVMVIEPCDQNIPPLYKTHTSIISGLWQGVKNSIKKMLGRKFYYEFGNYEPSGNYIYTVSRREFEKVALGLNLPYLITKELNDHYIEGVEFEKISENGPLLRSLKKHIRFLDKQSKKGLRQSNIQLLSIIKEQFSSEFESKLQDKGYSIIELPRNPYLGE